LQRVVTDVTMVQTGLKRALWNNWELKPGAACMTVNRI